jgi:hypothetical protein
MIHFFRTDTCAVYFSLPPFIMIFFDHRHIWLRRGVWDLFSRSESVVADFEAFPVAKPVSDSVLFSSSRWAAAFASCLLLLLGALRFDLPFLGGFGASLALWVFLTSRALPATLSASLVLSSEFQLGLQRFPFLASHFYFPPIPSFFSISISFLCPAINLWVPTLLVFRVILAASVQLLSAAFRLFPTPCVFITLKLPSWLFS